MRDGQQDHAREFAAEAEACGHDLTTADVLDVLASCGLTLVPGAGASAAYAENLVPPPTA